MHTAIEDDAVTIVESCIQQGADLAFTIDGITAMEKAALSKKWDIVIKIAQLEMDSSGRYRYINALFIVIHNNKEFVNPTNEQLAIYKNQELAAISLIIAGANLDKKIKYKGFTNILCLAIKMRNSRLIELLVKTNPNILQRPIPEYYAPLAYAALLACMSMQKEKTVIYAQKYWDIMQLLIPYAIKWKKEQLIPQIGWDEPLGFDEALNLAAKCGNTKAMSSLINAGVSLDINVFENQKSVLDIAAKYNHFPIAALSLYLAPGLEKRTRMSNKYELQNPVSINKNIVETGKLWIKSLHIFLERCTLLLRAFSSTESIFSHCPKDLHPLFFMNLILAMSEDLYLNIENIFSKDRFNIHLTEQRIVNVLSNINWTHKILPVIEGYVKQFMFLCLSSAPTELDLFIKEVCELHDARTIQLCIHKAISSPEDPKKRILIKNFLFEYNVLNEEQANEISCNFINPSLRTQ